MPGAAILRSMQPALICGARSNGAESMPKASSRVRGMVRSLTSDPEPCGGVPRPNRFGATQSELRINNW
jgi:hypothetical protein